MCEVWPVVPTCPVSKRILQWCNTSISNVISTGSLILCNTLVCCQVDSSKVNICGLGFKLRKEDNRIVWFIVWNHWNQERIYCGSIYMSAVSNLIVIIGLVCESITDTFVALYSHKHDEYVLL